MPIDKASDKNGLPLPEVQSSLGEEATASLRLDLVHKHLEKVVASAGIRRSKNLCQFLRFTVEEALRGHGSELKEYAIGVVAFRRSRQFNTGADPIVRVQARRLRSKLKQYYQGEGREEPIRIEYPVGSYSPVFVERTTQRLRDPLLAEPESTALVAPPKLIAVLPFLGVGSEGSEAFSEGLTDELIHALSCSDGIRVVAQSFSFQFKGRSEDVRRIGESLGVSALVSGSVRMEGLQVRVLIQLIDAETGVIVWSSAYDRELGSILAVQQEISHEVAAIVTSQFPSPNIAVSAPNSEPARATTP